MRGVVVGLVFGWLMALAAGCDSTPMPIPPSFDLGSVTMEETAATIECRGPCLLVVGSGGATEAGVTVVIHRLTRMPGDEPPAAVAIADGGGAFDLVIGGPPEGGFRAVVHGEGGTTVVDFAPITDGGPGPWRLEPFMVPPDVACLRLDPQEIDFGPVRSGWVETRVVELRNECDLSVGLVGAAAAYEPRRPGGPAFDVTARAAEVPPGGSVGVVVMFWPQGEGAFRGVLMVDVRSGPSFETPLLSVPLGGVATLR